MDHNKIQEEAIHRYNENMQMFNIHFPSIKEKLIYFQKSVEEARLKDKFILEYMPGGYFNIKDKTFGKYLYEQNSLDFAKEASSHINLNKTDSVLEGYYRYNINPNSVELVKKLDVSTSAETTLYPIISYANNLLETKNEMKEIKKFIFFGVALGTHITEISSSISNLSNYFIIENNIELFYHSLYVTNYAQIAKKANLYFSIADDKEAFKLKSNRFLIDGFTVNHYIKYFMLSEEYKEKLTLFQTFVMNQSHMGYTHEKLLKKFTTTLTSIQNGYSFLNISKHFNDTIFDDKAVLFLAAGPSLDINIEWLKKNHSRFIIVSAFMILPRLQKEGITPDIIMHIDEGVIAIRDVLSRVNLFEYAKDAIFLFSPSLPFSLFDVYNIKDRIFLFEDRSRYKINNGYIQGSSVGDMGYAMTLLFNTKSIFLLGVDLALHGDKTHADGHMSSNNMSPDNKQENITLRDTKINVKGNFQDNIITTPLFDSSITHMNEFTKQFKTSSQNVYNLNDGAYFDETIPLRCEDIDLSLYPIVDKNNMKEVLLKNLEKYSSHTLSKEEIKLFESSLKESKTKLRHIIKFNSKKFVTIDKFYTYFIDLCEKKLYNHDHDNSGQLPQVLAIYMSIVGGYLSDIHNSKKIGNEKKVAKELQNIMSLQLNRLVTKYKNELEKIVDKYNV